MEHPARSGDLEHDGIGLTRVRRPVHLPPGIGDRCLELLEMLVEVIECLQTDRPRAVPHRISVWQRGQTGRTQRREAAGRPVECETQLPILQGLGNPP